MRTRDEALAAGHEFIERLAAPIDDPWVVCEDLITEHDFGWVLPFVNMRFRESGDWKDERLGHSAVIVDRRGGDVHLVESSKQLDVAIAEYVASRPLD